MCSRTSPSVLASGLEKDCWFNIVSTTRTHLHGFIPPNINPNSTRPEEEPKQRKDRGRKGTGAKEGPRQKRNRGRRGTEPAAAAATLPSFSLCPPLASTWLHHVMWARDPKMTSWPESPDLNSLSRQPFTLSIDWLLINFFSLPANTLGLPNFICCFLIDLYAFLKSKVGYEGVKILRVDPKIG